MSIRAVHCDSALVVSVHGNDPAMLERAAAALGDVVRHRESLVVDLSDLTLAPVSRIVRFIERLAALAESSPAAVVVVADRLSARRVLNRLMRESKVRTAPSVTAALEALKQRGVPRPTIPAQAHAADGPPPSPTRAARNPF